MRDWPEGIKAVLVSRVSTRQKSQSQSIAQTLHPQTGPTFFALVCLLRTLLHPLVTPKCSHGERYPTENKTKSAYRCNSTQPASTAECHQVKAAGEYKYSNCK